MAYRWLEQVGNLPLTTCTISYDNLPLEPPAGSFTQGSVKIESVDTLTFTPSEDFTITMRLFNNGGSFNGSVRDIPNDEILANTNFGNRVMDRVELLIAINDDTQKADIVWIWHTQDFPNICVVVKLGMQDSKQLRLYELIQGAIPPLYTWQSVQSISGKKGTLSLTQILNINDGEPVENVANRGNLDFSKKTKVNTLVNSVYEPTYKEDATKATVEYEIPEAEYQYTKLVYKKKKIPKSPNDGTAIDIGADDTEVFVSGLEENTTYYFVVFTNRTKSNAYKFKTGKNAPPEGIFKIRITTSQGVKDNEFKENIEVTRV